MQPVIADARLGLRQAVAAVMGGAALQRCRDHFLPRTGTVTMTVNNPDLHNAMPAVGLAGGAGQLWLYGVGGAGEQLHKLDRLMGGSWPCGSSAHGPTRLEFWRPGTGWSWSGAGGGCCSPTQPAPCGRPCPSPRRGTAWPSGQSQMLSGSPIPPAGGCSGSTPGSNLLPRTQLPSRSCHASRASWDRGEIPADLSPGSMRAGGAVAAGGGPPPATAAGQGSAASPRRSRRG